MDKTTLAFIVRDGLASQAQNTGIVSGKQAEAMADVHSILTRGNREDDADQ